MSWDCTEEQCDFLETPDALDSEKLERNGNNFQLSTFFIFLPNESRRSKGKRWREIVKRVINFWRYDNVIYVLKRTLMSAQTENEIEILHNFLIFRDFEVKWNWIFILIFRISFLCFSILVYSKVQQHGWINKVICQLLTENREKTLSDQNDFSSRRNFLSSPFRHFQAAVPEALTGQEFKSIGIFENSSSKTWLKLLRVEFRVF